MESWAERARFAEQEITRRHLRRWLGIPGTRLGLSSYPPVWSHRLFAEYNYWWQAHLMDCLIDAQLRDPTPDRRRSIELLPRTVRIRNWLRWINRYNDDIAWLALAMERAERHFGSRFGAGPRVIERRLYDLWRVDGAGGGIPWRRGDKFRNVPANGTMAILMARLGHVRRAREACDWMDARMLDRRTFLILEGIRPGELVTDVYTYNQGLVLGAELELARRGGDRARIHRLTRAVADHLLVDGAIVGRAGGDGGLFSGILSRYLTLVALELPGDEPADGATRELARRVVLDSAASAWANRAEGAGGTFFGDDWVRPAVIPPNTRSLGRPKVAGLPSSAVPSRDFTVQLSGWMLLEGAAALERGGPY